MQQSEILSVRLTALLLTNLWDHIKVFVKTRTVFFQSLNMFVFMEIYFNRQESLLFLAAMSSSRSDDVMKCVCPKSFC